MMRAYLVAALVLLAPGAALADPVGKWRVNDGTAHIQIRRCGQALCGAIAWMADRGGFDENNPDPAQRKRPLLGLTILTVTSDGANQWSGTVYNAKDGQNYAARLTQNDPKLLKMEGCVPGSRMCGEESWTRVR